MEDLEEATPEEQARAAASEWRRLVRANDTPVPLRAFVARQHQACDDRFLGAGDRAFLSRSSQHHSSRLPEAQTRAGALSLHRAVAFGDCSLIKSELDSILSASKSNNQKKPVGIDDLRNSDGETLLHIAVLHQQLEIVKMLLELGASPHVPLPTASVLANAAVAPGKYAASPASVAPRSENFRASRLLHAGEATALHYACTVGNLDILKLLLRFHEYARESGRSRRKGSESALLRSLRYREGSLLVMAIANGHAHIVSFLLRSAIEFDCSDEDGNNAFGVAALLLGNNLELLRRVLRVLSTYTAGDDDEVLAGHPGLEINHKNSMGLTAYDVAEMDDVRETLAKFGARTARVVAVERVLRWDREAFRRDVRLSSEDSRRPRAAFPRHFV